MRGAEFKVGRNLTGRRDWLGGIIAGGRNAWITAIGMRARENCRIGAWRIHFEFRSMDHGIRVVIVM